MLNKKRLLIDTEMAYINHITDTLKSHGIRYEIKTLQNHTKKEWNTLYNEIPRAGLPGMLPGNGMSFWDKRKIVEDPVSEVSEYVYVVFVKRKDYKKAKEICGIT